MTDDTQWTIDETIEIAMSIFTEMAPDNLPVELIHLFNESFSEDGYVGYDLPGEDWQDFPDVDPEVKTNPDNFLEILIGLEPAENRAETHFAKLLVCRNKNEKDIHIDWLPEPGES